MLQRKSQLWVIYGPIRSHRQPGKGQERLESGPKSALAAEGDYVPNPEMLTVSKWSPQLIPKAAVPIINPAMPAFASSMPPPAAYSLQGSRLLIGSGVR